MEDKIPEALRLLPQWIVWRTDKRGPNEKPTKLPFSTNGRMAKSNDPTTWASFSEAVETFNRGGYDGVGFMFSATDEFCGIDLDGCRNPQDGKVAEWAKEIIATLNTYSEVSPSETGVKMFCRAKLPAETGRKKELEFPTISGKQPAIEVYDKLRYFAVTGKRLAGVSPAVEDRGEEITDLCKRFWPTATQSSTADFYAPDAVIERARKYIAMMPAAISGSGGHNAAFKVACVLSLGFGLVRDTALALLREWNQTCQPPWSDRELEHKIDSALKQPGERNYLRNTHPARWTSTALPEYTQPKERSRPRATTLSAAMADYIDAMQSGHGELFGTGIAELDYAVGGGLTFGELFVVAGRPSHGKSVCAMQAAHHWTECMIPTLVITEEMSKLALGRRALLFTSDIPEEHWKQEVASLRGDIEDYRRLRAECYIVESCQTMAVAEEEIRRHIDDHGVQAVIIDYAQLLQSKGMQRWEQMANTSECLRRLVSDKQIVVLALVQMNQEIEKRPKFLPKLSDLGDTGQWSRDADVIAFVVWPHRFDYRLPANEYKLYVAKNRNRPINSSVVTCRFEPSRQRIVEPRIQDMSNYEPAFAEYEQG